MEFEFKSFDDFLNERYVNSRKVQKGKPMNSSLRKSLDKLGKSFKNDDEIIKVIELLGFSREPRKANSSTSEYVFIKHREDGIFKYVTYTTGYVRALMPTSSWFARRVGKKHNMTPISDQYIPTTRDRLLMVLRRALKSNDMYKSWMKSSGYLSEDPVSDFLTKKGSVLIGKKYGL